MATRNPLVIGDDGNIRELPSGDTVNGASGGGGGGTVGLTKLTISAGAGGGTLISRSGWTLSASRTGGGAVANAVDGSTGSRWATGGSIVTSGGSQDFFLIDTGSSQTIGAVVDTNTTSTGDIASSGIVQTSPDNVTYTTVASWTTANISGGVLTVSWTPGTARYVKLLATGSANGGGSNWWSIDEINLWTDTPVGVASLTVSETVTGANGKVVFVRGMLKRPSGEDVGLRFGIDASNWYGFRWTSGGTFQIEKCVAGSVTQIGSTASFSTTTAAQGFELIVQVPPSGSTDNWLLARMYRQDGSVSCVATTDTSLTLNTGTLHFFGYASANTVYRGAGYTYGDA
jgi:hypothetical protein